MASQQVEAINARSTLFTWQKVAERTWDFYESILGMPSRAPELDALLATNGSQPAVEPVERSWRERVVRAWGILRSEGWNALWQEIQQLIRWLRA